MSKGENFFFFHSCDYNTFSFYILHMWWESKKWISLIIFSIRVELKLLTFINDRSGRWGVCIWNRVCQYKYSRKFINIFHLFTWRVWAISISLVPGSLAINNKNAFSVKSREKERNFSVTAWQEGWALGLDKLYREYNFCLRSSRDFFLPSTYRPHSFSSLSFCTYTNRCLICSPCLLLSLQLPRRKHRTAR